MFKLESNTKTLICIGSGGVGKTTMAASIAAGLVSEGKKVLVLTIDPSKRLTEALGIEADGEVHLVKNTTNLYGAVINHEKVFYDFLTKDSDGKSAERLRKNKLYIQLSSKLSGSQEFTSLVALYNYVSSEKYDLVVLDTPPSQHTWNFLKAPEKIAKLFNEGIAKWFRQGSDAGIFQKMVNLGTTQVLKALETLTGSDFMKELSDFFGAIQNWQGKLENYVHQCHRILTSQQTEFVLITALEPSRIFEAERLSKEIYKQGYRLQHVIINRVPELAEISPNQSSEKIQKLISYYQSLENHIENQMKQMNSVLKLYKCPELRQNSSDVKNLQETFSHIVSINKP